MVDGCWTMLVDFDDLTLKLTNWLLFLRFLLRISIMVSNASNLALLLLLLLLKWASVKVKKKLLFELLIYEQMKMMRTIEL